MPFVIIQNCLCLKANVHTLLFIQTAELFLLLLFTVVVLNDDLYPFLQYVQFHFWATVYKTVRPMLSERCLSCLSVTLVYCGQTA